MFIKQFKSLAAKNLEYFLGFRDFSILNFTIYLTLVTITSLYNLVSNLFFLVRPLPLGHPIPSDDPSRQYSPNLHALPVTSSVGVDEEALRTQ